MLSKPHIHKSFNLLRKLSQQKQMVAFRQGSAWSRKLYSQYVEIYLVWNTVFSNKVTESGRQVFDKRHKWSAVSGRQQKLFNSDMTRDIDFLSPFANHLHHLYYHPHQKSSAFHTGHWTRALGLKLVGSYLLSFTTLIPTDLKIHQAEKLRPA